MTKARFQSQQQQQQSSPTPTGVSISGGGSDFADGTEAAAMVSFLSAYGLDPAAIERLLQVRTRTEERGSRRGSLVCFTCALSWRAQHTALPAA